MSGWVSQTLADLVDFRNGLNFSEANDGLGLPIVKVKDFGDRHYVDFENLSQINPVGLKISGNQLLRLDDIVIVRSNGNKDLVGRSMIYAGPDDKVAFAGFCIRARVDKTKASPQFIHYWLRSPTTRERFSREGSGTGIQNVSQALLQSQVIALPPLFEQREIAGILGALDDKIEMNRKTAATLEAMARALYRSWFVDFDPVWARLEGRAPAHMDPATAALFPDRFTEDGLPEGWRMGTLGDLITFNPKEVLKKGVEAPYLDMRALPTSGLMPDPPILREFSSGTKFRPGDTLLARITPCLENGKTAMVDDLGPDVVGWGSTEFIVMRAKDDVLSALPYCIARDGAFRLEAIATMTGSSGRQRADEKRIADLPLAIPTAPVLDAFGALTGPWIRMAQHLGRQSQTLASLRNSLLPRLMSGELRAGAARETVGEVA